MIPEYDAIYDLKRQWSYEFVPFLSNQPGIDTLMCDIHFNRNCKAFEIQRWEGII